MTIAESDVATGFALGLLGRLDVAVYDGSMHAWSADLSRPVEM
jgi:3-mercaptopyruvate sulfurtransferase SseA